MIIVEKKKSKYWKYNGMNYCRVIEILYLKA